jgi:hypothetical protein
MIFLAENSLFCLDSEIFKFADSLKILVDPSKEKSSK